MEQNHNKPADHEIFDLIVKIGQNAEGAFDITEDNIPLFKQLIHRDLFVAQEIVDYHKIKNELERRIIVTQKLVDMLRHLDKSIDTLEVLRRGQGFLDSFDRDLDQSRILGYVTPEQINKYGVEFGLEHMRVKENMIYTQDLRTGKVTASQQDPEKQKPYELKSNPLLDSDS